MLDILQNGQTDDNGIPSTLMGGSGALDLLDLLGDLGPSPPPPSNLSQGSVTTVSADVMLVPSRAATSNKATGSHLDDLLSPVVGDPVNGSLGMAPRCFCCLVHLAHVFEKWRLSFACLCLAITVFVCPVSYTCG